MKLANRERIRSFLNSLSREHSDFAIDFLFAIFVGSLVGVIEGALYGAGPSIPLFAYWSVLLVLLISIQRSPLRHSWPLVLVSLVFQDWFSLVYQGMSPFTADWYAAVFGDNIFTRHHIGVPNWYLIFFIIGVAGSYYLRYRNK